MNNKLHLVPNPVSLACRWMPTGDPRMPLACVWIEAKAPQTPKTASSTNAPGRMHLCA
jgi:hypothetical protein